MQHLMQIDELLLNFNNRNSKSKIWIPVILSITVTCCTNIHILIRSPVKITLYNVCSVHRGMFSTSGVFSTSGDTMSTSGDTMSTSGGYHEYIEGAQYIGGIP